MGIRVPIVEALFRRTNENKNGPELSEAILVPVIYPREFRLITIVKNYYHSKGQMNLSYNKQGLAAK